MDQTLIDEVVNGLELIAAGGRPAWEQLFQAIKESHQSAEIMEWLFEWATDESDPESM